MQKANSALQFNYEALKRFYIDNELLQIHEFDSMIRNTNAVRGMNIEGLNWLPIDQVSGQFRHIPMSAHYQAMALCYNMSFKGIEDFYLQAIKAGALPPRILNRTQIFESPSTLKGLKLGNLLIRLGMISEQTLQRALGIQQMIEMETKSKPFLAAIIHQIGHLSEPDLYQALGIQVDIPYVSLDFSVDKIAHAIGNF